MFNFFKSKGQHQKEVHIISSRHPTQIVTVYSDREIDMIDALRAVDDELPAPEPGESREIKTFFGRK